MSQGVGLQARHHLGVTVELSQVYERSMLPHTQHDRRHYALGACIIYGGTFQYTAVFVVSVIGSFFFLFSDVK
jgi:hypothetical protein